MTMLLQLTSLLNDLAKTIIDVINDAKFKNGNHKNVKNVGRSK